MPEPRRTFLGSLAAFGARRMARFVQWRAAREARTPRKASGQVFRGFVQINLIRLE